MVCFKVRFYLYMIFCMFKRLTCCLGLLCMAAGVLPSILMTVALMGYF
ncbi:MAG: hypothetical protein ACTSXP_07525 [Promethearchaeota archaeon]